MRLREKFGRRARRADAPVVILRPESHLGQAGVSVWEDGVRIAWGRDETAALANWRVSRAA